MQLETRATAADQERSQRIVVWKNGTTTEVKVIVLAAVALVLCLACVIIALNVPTGVVKNIAVFAAIAGGIYFAIQAVAIGFAALLGKVVGSGDAD